MLKFEEISYLLLNEGECSFSKNELLKNNFKTKPSVRKKLIQHTPVVCFHTTITVFAVRRYRMWNMIGGSLLRVIKINSLLSDISTSICYVLTPFYKICVNCSHNLANLYISKYRVSHILLHHRYLIFNRFETSGEHWISKDLSSQEKSRS
eukprot:sb/3473480/